MDMPAEPLNGGHSTSFGETEAADDKAHQAEPLLDMQLGTAISSSVDPEDGESTTRESTIMESPPSFETMTSIDENRVMRRVNWHILPIFFALAMLCSIDRANLSFAATQLNHDMHFSKSVYGYGSGIFFIGYAVMALPTPYICAKTGAPLFLGSILIIWGCTATLFAFMTSSWQFLTLRFLLGIAESGAYPGMWYQLALFYTPRELGLAYTIVSTASSLSGAAGGPLASVILRLDGQLGFRGWQWLFLLEGIPPVLLGLFMIFFLAKDPSEATFLEFPEREWLMTRRDEVSIQKAGVSLAEEELKQESKDASPGSSLMSVLREWRMWWLSAIWAIVVLNIDLMVFWIPLMLRSMLYSDELSGEMSEEQEDEIVKAQGIRVAQLSCIPFASAALGMLITASICKRTGERHWGIIIPLFVGMIMLVIIPPTEIPVPWLGFAFLSVACAGIWGPHGPLLSWPAKILEGTAAAAGFALIKTLGAVASFVGNAAMGRLYDWTGSFAVPTYILAVSMFMGAVLGYTFKDQDGKRAISPVELVQRIRGLDRSRSDPVEYNLSRDTKAGLQWQRARGIQAEPKYTALEMPDMPAFSTEDLSGGLWLDRR